MPAEFDHIVVAADTLERGVAYVEHRLGAACQPGGEHPSMGTHNALLRLGADAYIEIIAINPKAQPISTPRWFGLDDPDIRKRLRERPRLLTWVARTNDLDAAIVNGAHKAGTVHPLQRGDLHWRVALPDDGKLLEHGIIPILMEWGSATIHPSTSLPERGLRLAGLHASHPEPARLRSALEPLDLGEALTIEHGTTIGLQAEIATEQGKRWLD